MTRVVNRYLAGSLVALLVAAVNIARAEAPVSSVTSGAEVSQLSERVADLERLLDQRNEQLARMQLTMDELRSEVQTLRGTIEESQHQISQISKRQRALYTDLERRLSTLSAAPPAADAATEAADKAGEPSSTTGEGEAATQDDSAAGGVDLPESDLAALDLAFNHVRNNDFKQAIDAYEAFLKRFSKSPYRVNAHYWLGQIYYVEGQYDPASSNFAVVTEKYPANKKAGDALLKQGLIAKKQGNASKAKQVFNRVIKNYPDSPSAKLAQSNLSQLASDSQ